MKEFAFDKYCIYELFRQIPEINNMNGELKEDLEWYARSNLAYCTFGVVCNYFIELLNNVTEHNKKLIKKIIKLIENFAGHENEEVRYVAQAGFIEPLLNKLKPTKDIEKYLLPKSLELAKEIGWDSFGMDYRVGWRRNNEWYPPYAEHFGIIANKPESNDIKLEEIYNQLYSPEDPLPGGVSFMLTNQIRSSMEPTILPKAEVLLGKLTERITDAKNKLSQSDFETAEVVMYNLRDAIKLAKDSKAELR